MNGINRRRGDADSLAPINHEGRPMAGSVTSFTEVYHSRKVRSSTKVKESTTTVVYFIIGTTDLTHDVAESYAKTNGPAADQDLVRSSIDIDEFCPGYYRAAFNFAHPDSDDSQDDQQPGDPNEFSFDTTGGTTHIKTSLSTQPYPSLSSPNYKNAIGVSDGENVEGVDIIIPQFKYTEKTAFASVSLAYAKTLSELTGKVNDDTFKGWAAGEVLFLGATGSQRGSGPWEVSFHFAMEKNVTNLTIGDITGIAKNGHQYLWALFEAKEDQNAQRLVRQPVAVYVEDVYEEDDFGGLSIGT